MKSVRVMAKGTKLKPCALVDKVVSQGCVLIALTLLCMNTGIEQVSGWTMVGARCLTVGVTHKQREEARMIHAVVD